MGLMDKLLGTDEQTERERLRNEVLGSRSLPCFSCGAPTHDRKVVTTRNALSGRTVEFGACVACRTDHAEREVVAWFLDCRADEPWIDRVKVPRYADLLPTPIGTQHPFAHVDVTALAEQAIEAQESMAGRTGGPCTACGLSVLPEGVDAGWSRQQAIGRRGKHLLCPGCIDRFVDAVSDDQRRAIVAGVLSGYTDDNERAYIPLLAEQVVLWRDLPEDRRVPGGDRPWAHMSVGALRVAVDELIAARQIPRRGGIDKRRERPIRW